MNLGGPPDERAQASLNAPARQMPRFPLHFVFFPLLLQQRLFRIDRKSEKRLRDAFKLLQ